MSDGCASDRDFLAKSFGPGDWDILKLLGVRSRIERCKMVENDAAIGQAVQYRVGHIAVLDVQSARKRSNLMLGLILTKERRQACHRPILTPLLSRPAISTTTHSIQPITALMRARCRSSG